LTHSKVRTSNFRRPGMMRDSIIGPGTSDIPDFRLRLEERRNAVIESPARRIPRSGGSAELPVTGTSLRNAPAIRTNMRRWVGERWSILLTYRNFRQRKRPQRGGWTQRPPAFGCAAHSEQHIFRFVRRDLIFPIQDRPAHRRPTMFPRFRSYI